MGRNLNIPPFTLITITSLLLLLFTQPIFATTYNSTTSSLEPPNSGISSLSILLFVFILFLAVGVAHLSSLLKHNFIPESILVILLGIVFGLIGNLTKSSIVNSVSVFNPESFFLFIIPIIIFETGFSLHKQYFFQNLHIILVLATIGTLISFIVTGIFIWGMGKAGISTPLPWFESLLIGAISCATDPVATLAIFKALDVDPTLYIIVMGESILNDAVSLILYQSVLQYTLSEIWKPFLLFFVVSIGSVLIGVAVALILSLMLKYFNLKKFPALETIYVLIFSYISYLISDSLGLSGILSCFFSGITFSQYGYYILSSDTTHTVTQFLRTYAFIGETIAFLYIGISLPQHHFSISPTLILLTFLILVASRALSVYPIFYLFNKLSWLEVPKSFQIIIWFAGLRGAISFSLCLSESYSSSEYYNVIQTTILFMVYLTIGIFGLGTYPLLRYFHIKSTDHDNTLDSINKPFKESRLKYTFLSKIDKYLKHFFNISSSNNTEDIDIKNGMDSNDQQFIQLEEINSNEISINDLSNLVNNSDNNIHYNDKDTKFYDSDSTNNSHSILSEENSPFIKSTSSYQNSESSLLSPREEDK